MAHAVTKSKFLCSLPHCRLLPVALVICHSVLLVIKGKITSTLNLVKEVNLQISSSSLWFGNIRYFNFFDPAQVYCNICLRNHCIGCTGSHFLKYQPELSLCTLALNRLAILYFLIRSAASFIAVNCKEYVCRSPG